MAPSKNRELAPGATAQGTFVLLCDWQGKAVWGSATFDRLQIGEFAWEHLDVQSRDLAKNAVARVATLRESQKLDVVNESGQRFRIWAWPLHRPDVAVCVLGVRIPASLSQLTEREQECLEWLGLGYTTRELAEKLGIGLTTVHTHLRRCREKLGLDTPEALIAFAAKNCMPPSGP